MTQYLKYLILLSPFIFFGCTAQQMETTIGNVTYWTTTTDQEAKLNIDPVNKNSKVYKSISDNIVYEDKVILPETLFNHFKENLKAALDESDLTSDNSPKYIILIKNIEIDTDPIRTLGDSRSNKVVSEVEYNLIKLENNEVVLKSNISSTYRMRIKNMNVIYSSDPNYFEKAEKYNNKLMKKAIRSALIENINELIEELQQT